MLISKETPIDDLVFRIGMTIEYFKDTKNVEKRIWKDAEALLVFLWSKRYLPQTRIISWNGTGFGLRVLANHVNDTDKDKGLCLKCVSVCRYHVDIAFCFLAEHGYMISLQTASNGNMLPGTIDGTPEDWLNFSDKQMEHHMSEKIELIYNILQRIEKSTRFGYKNKRGNYIKWNPILYKNRMLSVRNAAILDKPNITLPPDMKKNFDRSSFTGWLTV